MLHKARVRNILWQWHCHSNHRASPGCIWRWSLDNSLGKPPIHLCSFGNGNSLCPNRYQTNHFLYPLVDSENRKCHEKKSRQIVASTAQIRLWPIYFDEKNVSKWCKTYTKFTLIDRTIIFAYSGCALHLQIIETETNVFVSSSSVAIGIWNVIKIDDLNPLLTKNLIIHLFRRETICSWNLLHLLKCCTCDRQNEHQLSRSLPSRSLCPWYERQQRRGCIPYWTTMTISEIRLSLVWHFRLIVPGY